MLYIKWENKGLFKWSGKPNVGGFIEDFFIYCFLYFFLTYSHNKAVYFSMLMDKLLWSPKNHCIIVRMYFNIDFISCQKHTFRENWEVSPWKPWKERFKRYGCYVQPARRHVDSSAKPKPEHQESGIVLNCLYLSIVANKGLWQRGDIWGQYRSKEDMFWGGREKG